MRSLLRVLVASLCATSTAAADEPNIAYQQSSVSNGFKVHTIERRHAPMACEVVWFKVGTKEEVAHHTSFAISIFGNLDKIRTGLDRLELGVPAADDLEAARLLEEAR